MTGQPSRVPSGGDRLYAERATGRRAIFPMTSINGIKISHAIVTDLARVHQGNDGAIDNALDRLRKSALDAMRGMPIGKDASMFWD